MYFTQAWMYHANLRKKCLNTLAHGKQENSNHFNYTLRLEKNPNCVHQLAQQVLMNNNKHALIKSRAEQVGKREKIANNKKSSEAARESIHAHDLLRRTSL